MAPGSKTKLECNKRTFLDSIKYCIVLKKCSWFNKSLSDKYFVCASALFWSHDMEFFDFSFLLSYCPLVIAMGRLYLLVAGHLLFFFCFVTLSLLILRAWLGHDGNPSKLAVTWNGVIIKLAAWREAAGTTARGTRPSLPARYRETVLQPLYN